MTSVGSSVTPSTNLDGVKGVSIVDYDSRGMNPVTWQTNLLAKESEVKLSQVK